MASPTLPEALRTVLVHVHGYPFFDCAEKAVLPFVQLVLSDEGVSALAGPPLLSSARAAELGAIPALRGFLEAYPRVLPARQCGDRSKQGKLFRSAWAAVMSGLPGVRYGHAGTRDMVPGAGNFLASLCGLFPPLCSAGVPPAALALFAPPPEVEAGLRAAAAFFSTPGKAVAWVGVGGTPPHSHPRGVEQWEGYRMGARELNMPHARATDSTSYATVLVNGVPWVHAHWFLRAYEGEPERGLGEEFCGHAQLFHASECTEGSAELELRVRRVAWLREQGGTSGLYPEGMPELPPAEPEVEGSLGSEAAAT